MKSVATIKLKIACKKELLETMKQYSQSAQYVVDIGWDNGTFFKRELHDMTYYPVRETLDLPAQLVCSSRDKACEVLKALRKVKKPTKPSFKKYLTVRYDARSFTFKADCVSLVTINGRIKIPLDIPEYYWQYLDWNVGSADLIYDRKKRLFLHITFSRDINASTSNGKTTGVDVGINHVAVTSNRKFFSANQIKVKRRKFQRLRTKLQSKGTSSAKRLLKKVSGREKRFMRYWNHVISKQIVNDCSVGDTLVLEDIKGIRTNKGRRFNFWLHRWSFYQLHNFISYKAVRKGIKVVKTSPYNSSKTCSKCGQIGSRSDGFFQCLHCGYSLNADLNASFNLAKHNSMSDCVLVPVTAPNVSGDDAKAPFCELRQSLETNSQKPYTLV